jgi:chromosome segregation ATPase
MSQDFSCFAPTTSALMDRTEAPAPEDHGAALLAEIDDCEGCGCSIGRIGGYAHDLIADLADRERDLEHEYAERVAYEGACDGIARMLWQTPASPTDAKRLIREVRALIADLAEMREARDGAMARRERARCEQRSLARVAEIAVAAREKAEALADDLGAEMEAIWQDYRTADLGRRLAEDGCGQNHDRAEKAEAGQQQAWAASAAWRTRAEKAEAQLAALTLEVARLQAGASAVHASTVQARRAMTDVEERAEQAAMPWKRKTYSPEVAAMIRAAVRGDGLEKTR